MNDSHTKHFYFRGGEKQSWEEIELHPGSVTYHILFDMPAGQIYHSHGYDYKWELT